jgi:hypothetical protein
MASHILSQGADGIYLFNHYYGSYMSDYNRQRHIEEGGFVCRVNMPQLLNEIGSLETLKGRNKIYCLSDGQGSYGVLPLSPIPLELLNGSLTETEIYIGDDPKKIVPEEIILFLRLNKPSRFDLYVNGTHISEEKPEYTHLYDRSRGLQNSDEQYAFIVPVSCMNQGYNKITFAPGNCDSLIVKRLEVALKYGRVRSHGYF